MPVETLYVILVLLLIVILGLVAKLSTKNNEIKNLKDNHDSDTEIFKSKNEEIKNLKIEISSMTLFLKTKNLFIIYDSIKDRAINICKNPNSKGEFDLEKQKTELMLHIEEEERLAKNSSSE